jgi:hypothetical protein
VSHPIMDAVAPPRFKVNGNSNTSVWIIDTWRHGQVVSHEERAFVVYYLPQILGAGDNATIEGLYTMAEAYADLLNNLVVRT